jgi:hypothetical protein
VNREEKEASERADRKIRFCWLAGLPFGLIGTVSLGLGIILTNVAVNKDFDVAWGDAAILSLELLAIISVVFLFRTLRAYCRVCYHAFGPGRACGYQEIIYHTFPIRICESCLARQKARRQS